MNRREARTLAGTLILATALPLGARALVRHNTQTFAERLGDVAQVDARLESVEVDLSGQVHLRGLALGRIAELGRITASWSFDALLARSRRPDRVTVVDPRLAVRVDSDGSSSLSRLIGRIRANRPRSATTDRAGAGAAGSSGTGKTQDLFCNCLGIPGGTWSGNRFNSS